MIRNLTFKKLKILVLITYALIGILVFIYREYLYENWLNVFHIIDREYNEPFSYLSMFYYGTFSIYFLSFVLSPLRILEKKHNDEERFYFKTPVINKKYLSKKAGNFILILGIPIFLLISILILLTLEYTFSILAILFFASIIFLIITSLGQKIIKLFNLILNNIQKK